MTLTINENTKIPLKWLIGGILTVVTIAGCIVSLAWTIGGSTSELQTVVNRLETQSGNLVTKEYLDRALAPINQDLDAHQFELRSREAWMREETALTRSLIDGQEDLSDRVKRLEAWHMADAPE